MSDTLACPHCGNEHIMATGRVFTLDLSGVNSPEIHLYCGFCMLRGPLCQGIDEAREGWHQLCNDWDELSKENNDGEEEEEESEIKGPDRHRVPQEDPRAEEGDQEA